ncbi:DUF3857 domain-containing protein [Mucilaginibacter boryungensis]|uniref:DUF3857 domain-containing protein n=1 Tax=Mucilaginibacter boryungensis TaxID=768480 RepID=A0ABR9XM58_9SPHI|nr:DUF3857 domain-containing protein [Mucilaginibacter boryungensis]MBE9668295.1 DUF3857 domain-containing protein [Mucilaginibacter boryungensis]
MNRITIAVLSTALFFSLGLASSYGQDKTLPKEVYLASGIPDSLKENANAVIRYTMNEITVKAPGKQVLKHHSITTVLNEKGDKAGEVVLMYNRKYDTYSNIEIKVYSTTGQLLKKYHKSDMYDRSATDDETIVTDDRLLAVQHAIASYPTTIEVSYEEDISSFTDLGAWMIRPKAEVAIEAAYCKVTVNPTVGFRYKAQNIALTPIKGTQGDMETYNWQVKNLKAVKPEDNTLSWQLQQKIAMATNNFEYYGIPGAFDSWQNFGKWIAKLNADVSTLSPERSAEIKKMTDTIKSDKDKVRFLYRYLQQNMRYVSVQLGIGGLKPFPAMFVDQKKYGDCKALSNYMYALLKAVNIPSYYAIINAGVNEKPADPDFPDNVFNHVILCVPLKGDTTWLECTSTTQPFGKLGTFTENRNALLITEDGGKLVSTPKSVLQDNLFDSYVHVAINPDGSAKAQLKFLSTGEYRSMYVGLASIKMDEQKTYLIKYLNLKQPSAFNFNSAPDKDGTKEINIDLDYDKFCDLAVGDKQFYKPSVFDIWRLTLPEIEKRKTDYYFEHPMQKSCVTAIDLPAGFEMETLPADVKLKFSYGNYEASYQYDKTKNQLTSTVKFKLNNQIIPAAQYNEMQKYMDDIARAQNKKMVIKRKA